MTQCEQISCPSSIWRLDLNSRPLEHEHPPITTRPGLPPKTINFLLNVSNNAHWLFISSLSRIPKYIQTFQTVFHLNVLRPGFKHRPFVISSNHSSTCVTTAIQYFITFRFLKSFLMKKSFNSFYKFRLIIFTPM